MQWFYVRYMRRRKIACYSQQRWSYKILIEKELEEKPNISVTKNKRKLSAHLFIDMSILCTEKNLVEYGSCVSVQHDQTCWPGFGISRYWSF